VTPVVSAVDPAGRKVARRSPAKQAFAGAEQHREGQQPVLVDELVPGEGAHQVTAAVHLQLEAGPPLQLGDGLGGIAPQQPEPAQATLY
jgi:hypothetical protein